MGRSLLCGTLFLLIALSANCSMYSQYWEECSKIVEGMSLEQKIGQTLQVDFEAITEREKQSTDPTKVAEWSLGGLLISGSAAPTETGDLATIPSILQTEKVTKAYLKKTSSNWKKLIGRFDGLSINVTSSDNKKYKIKLFLGSDATHGDQNVVGNVVFPHNIGLSCSHNEQHFENMGFWSKESFKKTGFNFAFGPSAAVSHNPQWGGFYESLGQEDPYIEKYGQSFVKGVSDANNGKINGVLSSTKGFFGEGATLFGASEGSASVMNYEAYINHNIPGFKGGISSNLGAVQASSSSTNYVPSSYDNYLQMGLLREELGFDGLVITNYDEIRRVDEEFLPRTFYNVTEEEGYVNILGGGTNILKLGNKYLVERVIKQAKHAVEKHKFPVKRLDESVTRILAVKMAMGLISTTNSDKAEEPIEEKRTEGSSSQYSDSLNAVQESLVLLKNEKVLPLQKLKSSAIKYVILMGEKVHNINRLTKIQLFRNFDNIGLQCGGNTIREQGFEGNDFWTGANKQSSNASSILDALKALQKSSNFELIYPEYTSFNNEIVIDEERRQFIEKLKLKKREFNSKNTVVIGAFGEFPYANVVGDVNIPFCKRFDDPGCLYRTEGNPYAPGSQKKTLEIKFTNFEKQLLQEVKSIDQTIPLVSVLFSGRPLIASEIIDESDAFIAAWLPGTSGGQGIVNAIVGDYSFRPSNSRANTLSMDWPKYMESLQEFPIYEPDQGVPGINNPQFKVGDGLSTAQSENLLTE